MIRLVFDAFDKNATDEMSLKFVIGKPRSQKLLSRLLRENQTCGDLHLLDIHENMDHGKTLEFFRSTNHLPLHYFYVKQDDDTFVHYANLFKRVSGMNRTRPIYYGRSPYRLGFYAGWAYMLSAAFLKQLPDPPVYTFGYEDQVKKVLLFFGLESLTSLVCAGVDGISLGASSRISPGVQINGRSSLADP